MKYPIFVQEHGGFSVVRGDLYPGGLKCCALTSLLEQDIWQSEIVYSGCYFGHSAFALATAALLTNKKVTLFFPIPIQDTHIFRAVASLNNVECRFIESIHQDEVHNSAATYANKSGAFLMPIGCDFELFRKRYTKMIASVCGNPSEVWISGGSGVTARCMEGAVPNALLHVVNLNVRQNPDFGRQAHVWSIPEVLQEKARLPPPWPSAPYYDAKAWQIIHTRASPGALIWGVA